MRFLIVRKADTDSEAGAAPTRELVDAMAEHLDTLAADGRFLAGEGLKPSRDGVRIHFAEGRKAVVVDGPFAETRELIAGFSIIEADSIEQAVAWVSGWPEEDAHGAAEVEVRPIGCPGGLSGFGDPAEGDSELPRYMVMLKANERSETDFDPGPEILGKMMEANKAGHEAGFLIAGFGLSSSRHAKRVRFGKGRATVFDGPFAEIKEELGGFYVIDVADLDEALAIAKRVPLLDGGSVEVRPLTVQG